MEYESFHPELYQIYVTCIKAGPTSGHASIAGIVRKDFDLQPYINVSTFWGSNSKIIDKYL